MDRPADKRGGGVLLAVHSDIHFNRITTQANWERLELVAIELVSPNSKKCLLAVCYRPPNSNTDEWLALFTSFLETTLGYERLLILGDFNFPNLTWNSNLICDTGDIPSGSAKFRELTYDFFLQQTNLHPTRFNNILDLVFTNSPESVSNISCVPPETMGIHTDHCLLFYDFSMHVNSSGATREPLSVIA